MIATNGGAISSYNSSYTPYIHSIAENMLKLIFFLSLGPILCGLPCRTLSCRAITCPGCEKAVTRFTDMSINIEGKTFTVSCCKCPKGRLFAIWALCCGWHRVPSRLFETMRSLNVVSKIQDRYLKPSNLPSAIARGVGYGSVTDASWDTSSIPHAPKPVSLVCRLNAISPRLCLDKLHVLIQEQVETSKQASNEDDPIQVSRRTPFLLIFHRQVVLAT